MNDEEVRAQISDKVKEMGLFSLAERVLIESTIKVYNEIELKNKDNWRCAPRSSSRIATALYLACDKHACIAIPKVKRACGNSIRTKYITKARKLLALSPATPREKLDSLCKICGVTNKEFVEKAHYFISLLDGHKSYSPSAMAASAFYAAHYQLSGDNPNSKHLTQKGISELTGCTEITIAKIVKDLYQRQDKYYEFWEDKSLFNGC